MFNKLCVITVSSQLWGSIFCQGLSPLSSALVLWLCAMVSSYLSKYFSLSALTTAEWGVSLALGSCLWNASQQGEVAGQRGHSACTRKGHSDINGTSLYRPERGGFGANRLFCLWRIQQSDFLHLFFPISLSKKTVSRSGGFFLLVWSGIFYT